MTTELIEHNGVRIALVHGEQATIADEQSALDLMATVFYEHDCTALVLEKCAFGEEFFDLRTGIAGAILQKVSNYHMRCAIVGDFSGYQSKSLRDFIVECNRGNCVFFLPTQAEAIERLGRA